MGLATEFDYGRSDDVFRFGWLEDSNLAHSCLRMLEGKAEQFRGAGVYESDAAAIFVEPLLRGLGWETLNHNQVDRAPRGPYPDYELFENRKFGAKRVAVMEVKKLDTPRLDLQTKDYEQLCGYVEKCLEGSYGKPEWVVRLRGEPIVCGVVTNGTHWLIYDFHGEHSNLKCEFDLQGSPDVRAFMEALSRQRLIGRLCP
jgi:hypothetical protein